MKLCCFLLFVFLFRFVFFSFAACYCHFFTFCCVFFSCRYHIRIQTNSSLFLTWKSSVRSLVISRDTSCDSVWPIKSPHASDVAKGAEAEALQRRESVQFREEFFQTSSCFYQSCSHGLIQSSNKAFHYAELWRDRSKDGLHVAAFSLQDSRSLGKLNKLNLTFSLWIYKAYPLFLRSKRKLHLISFLLGPKAFADNDLSAVECTQTDRVTLKNWNASCIVNYSRTSHTLIIQLLSFRHLIY